MLALFLLVLVPLATLLILSAGTKAEILPIGIWRLFWIGFAIGATWEIGFSLMEFSNVSSDPDGAETAMPVSGVIVYALIILPLACMWDAALMLAGLAMARAAFGPPVLRRWHLGAFFIMLLWGQLQSLLIEMAAIAMELWDYTPGPYNPELFAFGGKAITLLPQLVWLLAIPLFYAAALRILTPRSP